MICNEKVQQHKIQHLRDKVAVVKALIESYFIVVRKKIADLVPKTIMSLFVNYVRDALEHELISEIYHEVDIPHLMTETLEVSIRRNKCFQICQRLREAHENLDQIRFDVRIKQ